MPARLSRRSFLYAGICLPTAATASGLAGCGPSQRASATPTSPAKPQETPTVTWSGPDASMPLTGGVERYAGKSPTLALVANCSKPLAWDANHDRASSTINSSDDEPAPLGVAFTIEAAEVALQFATLAADLDPSKTLVVHVDGQPVDLGTPTRPTREDGVHALTLRWTTSSPRVISLIESQWGFRSATVPQDSGFGPAPELTPSIGILSGGLGMAPGLRTASFESLVAQHLGCLVAPLGLQAGTGFTAAGNQQQGSFSAASRLKAMAALAPAHLLLAWSPADLAAPVDELAAAAEAAIVALVAALPHAKLHVLLPFATEASDEEKAALASAALIRVAAAHPAVVSTIDPAPWLTGTGNIAKRVASGSRSSLIAADGEHLSELGERHFAWQVASRLYPYMESSVQLARVARSIPTASTESRLWAHLVSNGLPNYSDVVTAGKNSFGDLFTLDLVSGTYSDWLQERRPTDPLGRCDQAGVTGMQIALFDSNKGTDFFPEWDQAIASANDPTFTLAPCLIVTSQQNATRIIGEYLKTYGDRHWVAKIDGRPVVFIYQPTELSPEDWKAVRTEITQAGFNPFFASDLNSRSALHDFRFTAEEINPYVAASCFDGYFCWDERIDLIAEDVVAFVQKMRIPFFGGLMPSYSRTNVANGGFSDAEGTKRFRREWETLSTLSLGWNCAFTWNDVAERTAFQPTSNMNHTLADIARFYAMDRSVPGPQLYVTTPSHLGGGDTGYAEALCLNPGDSLMSVGVQILSSSGDPASVEKRQSIGARSTGDVTVPVVAGSPGEWIRVRATLYDAAGNAVQTATSAPVCSVDAAEVDERVTYYSIPARFAGSSNPSVTISNGTITASTTSPSIHYLDILQNTQQLINGFTKTEVRVSQMSADRTTIEGTVKTQAKGFCVARCIDSDEKVSYSDPVFY